MSLLYNPHPSSSFHPKNVSATFHQGLSTLPPPTLSPWSPNSCLSPCVGPFVVLSYTLTSRASRPSLISSVSLLLFIRETLLCCCPSVITLVPCSSWERRPRTILLEPPTTDRSFILRHTIGIEHLSTLQADARPSNPLLSSAICFHPAWRKHTPSFNHVSSSAPRCR